MNTKNNMRLAPCVYALALSLSLQVCTANAGEVWVKKVRNTTELINAMLTAGNSGMPALIKLVPGTYKSQQSFSWEDGYYGLAAFPPVNSDITIEGTGSDTTTLDADALREFGHVRVLAVLSSGRLTLRHVRISGGRALCFGDGCVDPSGGGGIANYGGVVRLDHCLVTDNGAFGIEAETRLGGGILNVSGSLRIDDSQIKGNVVRGHGAGLALLGGSTVMNRSTVTDNSSRIGLGNGGASQAGGILVRGGATVTMDSSTISGNRAGHEDEGWVSFGVGITNYGTTRLSHSAVIRNVGIHLGDGGGIFNGGNMTILDSTIGDNSAGTRGGGIYNEGSLVLKGVTIARNNTQGGFDPGFDAIFPPGCSFDDLAACTGGGGGIWNVPGATVRMVATLIVNNDTDCNGTLTTEGHNILGTSADCALQRSATIPKSWTLVDRIDVDARIGTLKSTAEAGNAYYPLLSNSPAIDTGGQVYASCSLVDQTGHARVDGNYDGISRCDIGAIEYRPR